tara:strand:+ start:9191 stop:10921 length:1731 start_codon:yes stop_codon:yes gene_type:complete
MKEILIKLSFIISKKNLKGLLFLSGFLLFGMILEILALAIILPTITTILEPNSIRENSFLTSLKEIINISDENHFIYFFLTTVILTYLIKTIFFVVLVYKQSRLINNIIASISNNLLTKYLNQSYYYFLNKSSAQIIKIFQVEINYISTFLLALITLFIEVCLSFSIIATLLYIEFVGAISIGLFFTILILIFFRFSKNKLQIWGSIREKIDSYNSKIIIESISGIKEVLLLGRKRYFIDSFIENNLFKTRMNTNQGTIVQIPRYLLELITIIGLVIFIFILIYQGKETNQLVSVLGVFVAGSFRIIPSLNRILSSLQQLKFYRPALEEIFKEFKSFDSPTLVTSFNSQKLIFKNKIHFEKLSFSYSKDKSSIFEDCSLSIAKGNCIGFIGESGSGKSTLIDLIAGLLKPSLGQIKVDDVDIFTNINSWHKMIGYIPQSIFLTEDSILRNIAFGINEKDIELDKVKRALKDSQLDSFVDSLKHGLNTKIGERGVQISGGQRQRIGIARALYDNPEILILDEATSSLDSNTENEVMKSINLLKGTKTLLIIAHRHSTLNECDIIYEVKKGKLNQVIF